MHWPTILAVTMGCLQLSVLCSQYVAVQSEDCFRTDRDPWANKAWRDRRSEETYAATDTDPFSGMSVTPWVRSQETIGCVVNHNDRMEFGIKFRSENFIYRCERLSNGRVTANPVNCRYDGIELDWEETWYLPRFRARCTRNGLTVFACLDQSYTSVSFGRNFTKDGFLYHCAKQGRKAFYTAIGCIIQNKTVGITETVRIGDLWYTCTRSGYNVIESKLLGCAGSNRERFQPGDRFHVGSFVYVCKKDSTGVYRDVVGCVGTELDEEKEYSLGQSWFTKPINGISYRAICYRNNTHVKKEFSQCMANLGRGRKVIDVGHCARYYDDNSVFICWKKKNGVMVAKVVTYPIGRYDYSSPTYIGEILCPRIDA